MEQTQDSHPDVALLIRQEMMLEQLRPIEDIIDAARKEVAKHRAACATAEATRHVDPQRLREATAAADGIDELLSRFDSMVAEVGGVSKVGDQALKQMHETLKALRSQMTTVVAKLETLGEH